MVTHPCRLTMLSLKTLFERLFLTPKNSMKSCPLKLSFTCFCFRSARATHDRAHSKCIHHAIPFVMSTVAVLMREIEIHLGVSPDIALWQW